MTMWEVAVCELAVEFAGGGIISLCGGEFVFEVAEVDSFAVANDGGPPEAFLPVEVYTFVS